MTRHHVPIGMLFPSTGKAKALLCVISSCLPTDSVLHRTITAFQFDVHKLDFCSKKNIFFSCAERRQEVPFKMWEGRKLLIAAFIFTALSCKVTSVKPLDMAPDGVDGPYVGCRKEAMEKIIHSGLLRQELNASEGFQKAWSANAQCPKLIPGGTKEHTAALLTYANGDEDFKKTFNDAVKTFGGNASTYENHFHFKSLHFLLMDSMFLQNPNKCQTVYILQEHYTAKKGLKVTFGKFTEVHSDYNSLKKMEDFDGQVLLNITSCIFVNLGVDICRKEQDMTLISPTEVFTVEEVKNIYDDINDSRYTEFILKHSEQDRMQHCYFFSRSPADVSPQWLVFVLVASSLITFHY